MRQQLVFNIFFFVLQYSGILAQNVPPIACPQLFQYLSYDQQYIGHIALPLDPNVRVNTLQVKFSQRVPPTGGDTGALTIMDNEDTIRSSLKTGRPLNYRVDFPSPGILPKLTEISINDLVLCRAQDYPPNSWTLSLQNTLRSESTPLNVLQPGRLPEFQPERVPTPPRRPLTPAPTFQLPTVSRLRPQQQGPTSNVGAGSSSDLNSICGRERAVITPLIAFGRDLTQGQMPWMVALFQRESNGISFLCGGTLISASTVVSAAHCFRFGDKIVNASRTGVSLGRKDLDLLTPGQQRRVINILIQDEYQTDFWTDADIALLQLNTPVVFTDSIKPICLWNENYLLDLPSGHRSYVAGWGADEKGNANTKIAKITDVDILTNNQCINDLRLPDSKGRVTSRTICATNKQGAGPCSGDSGGGLMLEENSVWVLRGIVSAGQVTRSRCDLSQPVIYTDLARHINWLRTNMWI